MYVREEKNGERVWGGEGEGSGEGKGARARGGTARGRGTAAGKENDTESDETWDGERTVYYYKKHDLESKKTDIKRPIQDISRVFVFILVS